jgi:hypothetical protein
MNGRVYDPKLGRFLSADPFVQAPANTQSHNRYSYVLNNPLSFTDPSGYFLKKLFGSSLFRTIASIAITAFAPQWGILKWAGDFGANAIAGFAAGVAAGGGFKGGVLGAFSAGLFMGIHNLSGSSSFLVRFGNGAGGLSAAGVATKSTLHGLAGGVMSTLSGGKFGHGFVSAFVTQAAAGPVGRIGDPYAHSPGRVVAAAVVGGTAAELSGGKFDLSVDEVLANKSSYVGRKISVEGYLAGGTLLSLFLNEKDAADMVWARSLRVSDDDIGSVSQSGCVEARVQVTGVLRVVSETELFLADITDLRVTQGGPVCIDRSA